MMAFYVFLTMWETRILMKVQTISVSQDSDHKILTKLQMTGVQ